VNDPHDAARAFHRCCRDGLAVRYPHLKDARPVHRDFRAGDVLHSQADIGKARRLLGYEPTHSLGQGLAESLGVVRGAERKVGDPSASRAVKPANRFSWCCGETALILIRPPVKHHVGTIGETTRRGGLE